MEFDFSRLRGRILTVYKTQEAFAVAMEKSVCSINQKLNNKTQWTAVEIRKACELLGIHQHEIPEYFFVPKIEKTQPAKEEC